ncbi:MAG: hypothetical protein EAX95_03225 [Candidatus Thorarchaeota archaeon]|nr:hypothetical protein [Candidatus Thorarchaeota archaeon]
MRLARKARLILFALTVALSFNVTFIVLYNSVAPASSSWPFLDLGPGLMQDSYSNRAPSLESPFGMIGDIPGGYSLYAGCPLQPNPPDTLLPWIPSVDSWAFQSPSEDIGMALVAFLVSIVPLGVVLLLGRKSFGSAKTQ